VFWSGPDGTSRRRRLLLFIVLESGLGAVAVVYGLVTGLWATVVLGVILLLFAVYSGVVLAGLRRRDSPEP
jgi:hypothetical protein